MMQKNIGSADKIIRFVVALIIGVLYALGVISGTVALVALGVGVIFLVTGSLGSCPLYSICRISTRKQS